MVIFDMLEEYIAMSNVTLQTWTRAAVWNAVIYQRIVTEHFWIILLCLLSVTSISNLIKTIIKKKKKSKQPCPL